MNVAGPHKLLSSNTEFSKHRKLFASYPSADIKFSKTHLHKIEQSGGFLGRLLGTSLKVDCL